MIGSYLLTTFLYVFCFPLGGKARGFHLQLAIIYNIGRPLRYPLDLMVISSCELIVTVAPQNAPQWKGASLAGNGIQSR